MTIEEKAIVKEITKYRAICLIHRYLYYVKAATLVTDYQYDMMERKLKGLIESHPILALKADYSAHCPTQCPGSSNLEDYPRRLEQLAESLLEYHNRGGR